ncbi:unnamed protein product [Rhizoctonia solani]|uniref:Uncharacterized protein n=1 Tax=Rhizoctonia solani TaxID=456999 RepID=A0A8H3E836_9AGAM|nr:unnamed protein product [Rhizoctonia solani]
MAPEAMEEAVTKFLSADPPAILLLVYTTNILPAVLMKGSIDCSIYWGLNSPLKQAKKNRSLINCATTIVIMTTLQQRGISAATDIKKHPSFTIPLDFTENSLLAPMRNKTRSFLMLDKGLVKELYTNRVYGVGAIPRNSLSAEDAARRANQYAARVLLHGDPADGSKIFPPVDGRPLVPRSAVEKFKLQPAVDAGLLTVILENTCLGNLRVEQLSSLAHAADCLANAATALSEAARAVTESLTSETESKSEQDDEKDTASARDSTPENPELPTDLNLILLNPAPDPIAPPTESEIDQSEGHREEAGLIEELLLKGQITGTENNEPMSWEATETEEAHATNNINLVEPAEESQEPDVTSNNLHAELPAEVDDGVGRRTDISGIPAETEPLIDPEQSYRIVVENEADVLLWLCALVQKDQRIICYMPCGTPPLAFYKRLVESVTNVPVYFPERMGSARRDAAYKKYLESDNSVVLIPGTLSPNIVMEGANTWVIHVGWPPNRERYVAQIKNHQAKHNVILACTSDVNLYPSSVPLMAQTLTWPKDGDSVNALRQLFDQSLANVPDDLKEKVYALYIS